MMWLQLSPVIHCFGVGGVFLASAILFSITAI
jgi:hypothetical protein